MYKVFTITYHEGISPKENEIVFPHAMLDREIRDFLLEQDVYQDTYLVSSNDYFLFIYLRNGDRVDVAIF